MKLRFTILLLLLAAIAITILRVVTMVKRDSGPTGSAAWTRRIRVSEGSTPSTDTLHSSQKRGEASKPGVQPPASWAGVESADPSEWIANLRAVGCPESTIRDLVSARLIRRHQKRLSDLAARHAEAWDVTRNRPLADSSRRADEFESLRQELNREMETLLGISSIAAADSLRGWSSSVTGKEWMNSTVRVQVAEIERRYRNQRNEIERGQVPVDSMDQKQKLLANIRRAEQAELAGVLSPAELEELNFRNSPAVRHALSHLPEAASEEEFRRMVRAVERAGVSTRVDGDPLQRYALTDSRQGLAGSDMKEQESRLEAALKEALGEERYREMLQQERSRASLEERKLAEVQVEQWRAANIVVAESLGLDPVKAGQLLDRLQSMELAHGSGTESSTPQQLQSSQPGAGGAGAMERILELSTGPEATRLAVEFFGTAGPEWLKRLKQF